MTDTYILCRVGDSTLAIPGQLVEHLELVPLITPVPNSAPFVEGVALVRGRVVPVVSLRRRLGMPPLPHDMRSRVVVVRQGERVVGLLADSARDFVRVPPEEVRPLADGPATLSPAFFAGAIPRDGLLALIVRVEAIIDDVAMPAQPGATVG